jgi:replication-associated recombination protein RarA
VTSSSGTFVAARPTVERIDEALTFDSGEAVAVLYGPGATDLFCCADLQLRAIDAVLLHRLKVAGYDRVVFCTLDGLYHLDEASVAAGRPAGDATAHSAGGLRRFSGPHGREDALAPPAATARAAEPARPKRSMADSFKVQQLHALMDGRGMRTAVVMLRAEDFLRHNVAARELADRIGEWLSHGTAARNLAVLVFTNSTPDEVVATLERGHSQGTLLAFLQGKRDATRRNGRIGRPDERELIRLVHRTRLHEGIAVADWTELPRLVGRMAARTDSVKDWYARLTSVGAGEPLSTELMRRLGWIDASTADGRSAWERLDELTGLTTVKEHIRNLAAQVRSRHERPQRSGRTTEAPSLHMVFTGNPGTGKTTVGHLMAEILQDIGVTRYSRAHEVEADKLVAGHVGQTAIRTNEAVDAALGGVLFVDEAYQLSAEGRGGFGGEAIDALVGRLDRDRDKFVAIVAGYPKPMAEFMAANAGLQRRFPTTIHFPDYEPGELLSIALNMLGGQHLSWDEDFATALRGAVELIHRERDPETFGNAGAMRNLVDEIERSWAARVGPPYDAPLAVTDIPLRYRDERPAAGCWERLNELTGLTGVKLHLQRLAKQAESRRQRPVRSGRRPQSGSPHLIFTGNPGTGKTTVARLMAEAYHDIGVLRSAKLHSVEASDLVAGYTGQTAIRTNKAVDAALGGVLFIDEAYRLSEADRGGFGQEAVDTLVTRLENNRDEFVVIAAGYPANMERFRTSNPGLPSRFPRRNIVHFPDYTPQELQVIVASMLEAHNLSWGDEFTDALRQAIERLYRERDQVMFGNAREMRELAYEIDQNWSNRVGSAYEQPLVVVDIPAEYRGDVR